MARRKNLNLLLRLKQFNAALFFGLKNRWGNYLAGAAYPNAITVVKIESHSCRQGFAIVFCSFFVV